MISFEEILIISVVSLVLTYIYTKISRALTRGRRAGSYIYHNGDTDKILAKCYSLFPNEIVNFKGFVYERGMHVRVTTVRNTTFEGRLVGINNKNIMCVLTQRYIAADVLDNILEIVPIGSPEYESGYGKKEQGKDEDKNS